MEIHPLSEVVQKKEYFIDYIRQNKIFIYPTDSLYGIGALFTQENINKITAIKQRSIFKKISIIAPNFEWIFEHFNIYNPEFLLDSFNKYPAITFIIEPKETSSQLALYKTLFENNTIGVRIIKHPIQELINTLGEPFISTSANIAGGANIKNISDLHPDIIDKVDCIIDGGEVLGIPSVLIFDKSKEILQR